ncbi:MAG: cation-translocating P-type ATPase [Nanoarchaeota archaeon]
MNKKNRTKNIQDDKFWHLRTTNEVFKELTTSKSGLNHNDVKKRLELYGENKLSSEKKFQWYKVLLNKINSILIYVLFGASIIAFISGETLEFIIIMIIILMTILLGFFQEYKADRTIRALNKLTAKKVLVFRNGVKKEEYAQNLVPGDIVYLKRGDIVPADIRILNAQGLQINESIITGESLDRVKTSDHLSEENVGISDMTNMAFSSTFVTKGSGSGIVVETGGKTFIGKISTAIENIKQEKSPIQKKIDLMSKKISYIVLTVAVLLFFVLLIKGNTLTFSLLLIGALAIAGIPESFPLALTLTFSNGIKKMAKQNAIVKDLNSVETLGTTTVICTDKTGTLTENKMRVTSVFLPNNVVYNIKGVGYEPINKFFLNNVLVDRKKLDMSLEFLKGAILCNDAELNFKNNEWKLDGEPTEGAILTFAKSTNLDENVIREDNKRVHVVPFDPLKKYMISVNKNIKDKHEYNFYLKGAGEIVLEKCSHYRASNNKIKPITPQIKKNINSKIEEFNSKGLRVLSIGVKNVHSKSKNEKQFISQHIEKNYVYEGFVAIEDPIREEVYDAVDQCHKAGIKTVIITGDHKLIAENIGRKLNLFTHKSNVILEGVDIDKLTDDELDEKINDVVIFARTTPEHKLRIVNSFQRNGEIVAMTGDGVNDAPALKKADIGISMGKNGTEVAREASNMVLTDDNFATIVKAVKEGRTVYSNIRRFIYYLLTGNFTEVGLIVLAVLIGIPLPLTALMILFVNLVTSTIPALALSIENTHEKVMEQKPRNPKEKLLSSYILTKILILVPLILFGTLGLFLWELLMNNAGLEKAMTIAFATLITFELFHAFNARRLHTTIFDKGFFNNIYLFIAVIVSCILMILAIESDLGQAIFSTTELLIVDWIIIFIISSSIIIFNEIIKLSTVNEFKEQTALQGLKIRLQ